MVNIYFSNEFFFQKCRLSSILIICFLSAGISNSIAAESRVNAGIPCPGIFVSASTTQNTLALEPNNINMDVVCLIIETDGGTDLPVILHSITFSTQGSTSTSDLTKARVFFTGQQNTYSAKTQYGQTVSNPSGTHTVSDNIALYSGKNYFWLVYDISKDAVIGNVVDFSVESIELTDMNGSTTEIPSPQNPAGTRPIIAPTVVNFQIPCPLVVPSMSYACNNNEKCYIKTIKVNNGSPFYNWQSCLVNNMINPLGGTDLYAWFDFRPGGASANHPNYLSAPMVQSGTTAQFSFTHFTDTWIMGSAYEGLLHVDWNQDNFFNTNEFSPPQGQGKILENGTVDVVIPPNASGIYTMTILFMTDVGFDYEALKNTNQLCGIACTEAWHICGAEVLLFPLYVIGPGGEIPSDPNVQNEPCFTAPPDIISPLAYSLNQTATALTATGTNLLWYDNPYNGTGVSTAPTPSTSTAGSSYYYVSQTLNTCESSRKQIEVRVSDPLSCVVICPNDTSVCINTTPFEFTGYSPPNGTFSGTGTEGNNGTFYNPQISGNYQITYTHIFGTCTFNITVNDLPAVSCPADTSVLLGEQFVISGENPQGGVFSGTGMTGNTFVTTDAGAGLHDITYTYEDPLSTCSSFCVFNINVLDHITCPSDTQICENISPYTLTGAIPVGGIYSGNGVISGLFNPSLAGTGLHDITYSLSSQQCTFQIDVLPVPELSLPESFIVCQDTLSLTADSIDYSYIWSTSDTTNTIVVSQSGVYSVTATTDNGCSKSFETNVILATPPLLELGEDIEVCDDKIFHLDAGITNAHYLWSTGSTEKVISIFMPGSYSVTVSDNFNCVVSDSIHVDFKNCSCDIFIPNSFSPNGDGYNEKFKPESNCMFTMYRLRIFNRWGEEVFVSQSPFEYWDGKGKNGDIKSAVYSYTLDYKFDVSHGEQQVVGKILIVL